MHLKLVDNSLGRILETSLILLMMMDKFVKR